MTYDFDKIIDRRNTNSEKYDFPEKYNVPKDALPMWVADMDFQTAPCIIEAMQKDLNLGIFGYSEPEESYFQAVKGWFLRRFGWEIKEEWIVKTPGIVFAIATAIRAITKPGEAVMIQPPVYYPFKNLIENNHRLCINNALINNNRYYEMNFDDFEEKIVKYQVKIFVLCSPHNPCGRVWTKEELIKVVEICKKYNVYIISDEIHADFIYPGHEHTVLANIDKDYLSRMIICTSPSKTFNLAGLQISNIMIPDENIREKFQQELDAVCYWEVGMFALSACEAAYTGGEEWLEQLKVYLKGNIDYMRDFLAEHLPKITLIEPEGTYLVWLDFSAYGYSAEELDHKMLHEAKVWLDAGAIFGEEGNSYQRVNIACPRSILEEAMDRMKQTFGKIR